MDGRRCSRQAVVGIQTLGLHVVNCNRRQRVGGEAGGVCASGEPGSGEPNRARAPRTAQDIPTPLISQLKPCRPWKGRLVGAAATHTGFCRGCWSPSWTARWSGRPSGDPPCAQRESGTSCLHCPWNRSCETKEFRRTCRDIGSLGPSICSGALVP